MPDAAVPKLDMILHRKRDGNFGLWACRGEGRGCKRNRYRKSIPCDDCVGPLPEQETIEHLLDRLRRGDA